MTARFAPAAAPTPPRTGLRRISQTQWVLIAMLVGVAVGYFFPDGPDTTGWHATDLLVLSAVFLRMIKSLIAPLLFATLVVGIAAPRRRRGETHDRGPRPETVLGISD